MRAIVPFDVTAPKTRLGPTLDGSERFSFAHAMCHDVLAAVQSAGHDPELLATGPVGHGGLPSASADSGPTPADVPDGPTPTDVPDGTGPEERDPVGDVPVTVDDRPLSTAVNAVLSGTADPLLVVMADLPLVTPAAIDRLTRPDAEVVVAPGLGGGTNALVVDHPDFRVDYHDISYRTHCRRAADVGASVAVVDSFRLAVDVDRVADLAEVLLHGEGRAADWLRTADFELETADGRPRVVRTGSI